MRRNQMPDVHKRFHFAEYSALIGKTGHEMLISDRYTVLRENFLKVWE